MTAPSIRIRAAAIIVENGRILLEKHAKDGREYWVLPGGGVDVGETLSDGLRRELREEIGLQLTEAPLRLFKLAASAETDQEHVWVYRCQAEGPFRLDPDEIERGGWFGPGEVTRWMADRPGDFASALLVIWKKQIPRGT